MTPLSDLDSANAERFVLHATVEEQAEALAAQAQEIANLREQLAYMRRQMFGRRREKIDPNQLRMFEQGQALLEQLEREAEPVAAPKPAPKKRGHGRAPFAAHLPREVIKIDVDAVDRCCPDCGEEMRLIGVDVTERGHVVPARMSVKRYERKKYACKHGHAVKVAPLPDGVVDRGKYEASVYAHVATSKYADHMPLNRIENIFKRGGVHLPRQTMWDLMVRLDELAAQPILKEMRRQMLEEDVLQADETPIQVQTEGESGTRRGFLWAWRNLRGSPQEKVLVEFKGDRSAKGPDAFLGTWSGTLLTDGYDGVNPVAVRNDIARAGCWSHARRKFLDALKSNKKRAAAVFRPIQRLFWIERAVVRRAKRDGLDQAALVELRRDVRDRLSRRVLTRIYELAFALDEDPNVPGGSKLRTAVRYVINQRVPLTALLRNASIPIHNNDTELDLRHVVTGRKNWLIFGSPRGGEVAGRLFSLVMSCKLAGIAPDEYLEDVLGLVSTTKASEIAKLTPWGWAAARGDALLAASS